MHACSCCRAIFYWEKDRFVLCNLPHKMGYARSPIRYTSGWPTHTSRSLTTPPPAGSFLLLLDADHALYCAVVHASSATSFSHTPCDINELLYLHGPEPCAVVVLTTRGKLYVLVELNSKKARATLSLAGSTSQHLREPCDLRARTSTPGELAALFYSRCPADFEPNSDLLNSLELI